MDSRQSPGAARVVGLEAASRNLREVLGIVLLLEKKDQDKVAGAMQGLVQQLLLAARCEALPPSALLGSVPIQGAVRVTPGRINVAPPCFTVGYTHCQHGMNSAVG